VLLTDGSTNAGRPKDAASAAAKHAGVPVYPIAFGTAHGTLDGLPVPVDHKALERLAVQTGGTSFRAASTVELQAVFRRILLHLSTIRRERDVTVWFLAAALLAAFGTAILALRWFGRMP
jgi:Ca-activated chloride channel family protein